MLKAVVDTNVFVSGLLRSPKSRRVIQAIRDGRLSLIISPEIFQEIIEVIARPKFNDVITKEIIQELRALIKTQAIFVRPRQKLVIIREEPDDNRFLEAAITGKTDYIISGDRHLLSLGSFRGISILTPTKFLTLLGHNLIKGS